VVLNPSTPVTALEQIGGDVDFVLVMSVDPGFGGQTFIPRSESKVKAVRALLDRSGNTEAPVAIDGGIDLTTAPRVAAAGARIIIAGSAIFHSQDPERATRELKAAANSAVLASSPAAR
jgi:ribulose-phosphate 3-epimerase